LPSPLGSIVGDVNRAFDAGIYYPALVVALTLPEICVALTFDSSVFMKEKHYVDFIDKYTTPKNLGLDGLSCYRLRGGVIHRGNSSGHPHFGATHVIFCVPETEHQIHALTLEVGNKASAMFSLNQFLNTMIGAVYAWYADKKDDPRVVENIPQLLSWRPNGISPFLRGAPVVGSGK
jgi:hypothetical protein